MMSLLILAALAGAPGPVDPQSALDFRAAHERVLQGDLQGAVGLYTSIEARGLVSADLYYDLGVALEGLDRPVDALVAFDRALRLDPADEDARFNRRALEARLGVATEVGDDAPGEAALAAALEPIVTQLPVWPAAYALLVAQTLAFLAWFAARRARDSRRRQLGLFAAAAFAVALGAGLVVLAHAHVARDPTGRLRVDAALLEGPHEKFEARAQAKAGHAVRITATDGAFAHVRLDDGQQGWVASRAIVPTSP